VVKKVVTLTHVSTSVVVWSGHDSKWVVGDREPRLRLTQSWIGLCYIALACLELPQRTASASNWDRDSSRVSDRDKMKGALQERIEKLKSTRLEWLSNAINPSDRAQYTLYYGPLVASLDTGEAEFGPDSEPIESVVQEFLQSLTALTTLNRSCDGEDPDASHTTPTKRVQLIFVGPPGSGKTWSLHKLEQTLWNKLNLDKPLDKDSYMPVFIRPEHIRHVQNEEFKGHELTLLARVGGFTMEDLEELPLHRIRPIWIMNSSELGIEANLSNSLNPLIYAARQLPPWYFKDPNYGRIHVHYLQPLQRSQILSSSEKVSPSALATVAGFYSAVDSNLQPGSSEVTAQQCLSCLLHHPASSWRTLQLLPQLVTELSWLINPVGDSELEGRVERAGTTCPSNNRFALLRTYTRLLFENGLVRATQVDDFRTLNCMEQEEFVARCTKVCESLALMLLPRNLRDGQAVGTLGIATEDVLKVLQETIPLKARVEGFESFMAALPIRKSSMDGLWHFEHPWLWRFFVASAGVRTDETLTRSFGLASFARDWGLLEINSDACALNAHLERRCIDVICETRLPTATPSDIIAASNAISVLNYASASGQIQFRFIHGQDWSGIQVPYANLSCADFTDCKLDGADLSGCLLSGALFHRASLHQTKMSGIRTGPRRIHDMCEVFPGPEVKFAEGSGPSRKRSSLESSGDSERYGSFEVTNTEGTIVASVKDDSRIHIRREAEGGVLCVLKIPGRGGTASIAIHPNEAILVCLTADRQIVLWDITSGTLINRILAPRFGLERIQFSPDGRHLVWGDRELYVDDVIRGCRPELRRFGCAPITCVALCASKQLLVYASEDGFIRVWNWEDRKLVSVLRLPEAQLRCMQLGFDPTGTLLVTLVDKEDGSQLLLWNLLAHSCVARFPAVCKGQSPAYCFDRDGKRLITRTTEHELTIWDLTSETVTAAERIIPPVLSDEPDPVYAYTFAFRPDGSFVVALAFEYEVDIWGPGWPYTSVLFQADVKSMRFSSDGSQLAFIENGSPFVCDVCTIDLWKTDSSSLQNDRICDVSHEHSLLLTQGWDNVRLWRLGPSNSLVCEMSMHDQLDPFHSAILTGDGSGILTVSDSRIRCWERVEVSPLSEAVFVPKWDLGLASMIELSALSECPEEVEAIQKWMQSRFKFEKK